MVQFISKHCGGTCGKQLSEVMDVFWKSRLQKTGSTEQAQRKERSAVLLGHSPAGLYWRNSVLSRMITIV